MDRDLIDESSVLKRLKKHGLTPNRWLWASGGASRLLDELKERFPFPDREARSAYQSWDQDRWDAWEAVGLYYGIRRRLHESLTIFSGCYDYLLECQHQERAIGGAREPNRIRENRNRPVRLHKGKPLVWMSDCYWHLGWPVHSKRYLMLSLCEDIITDEGTLLPERGVFYRSLWRHGLTEMDLAKCVELIRATLDKAGNRDDRRFPESVLQDIGHGWVTELPEPSEYSKFTINRAYVRHCLRCLGDGSGAGLEKLAHYLLSCMPGCRAHRRANSQSTDYDVVCSMDGVDLDYRSELGRYFICECKDWKSPADFTTMAKFASVLASAKARFGILFSRFGITGSARTTDAARQQLKVYQAQGIVIVVITQEDLEDVAKGMNLVTLLRTKYEQVRLDLQAAKSPMP